MGIAVKPIPPLIDQPVYPPPRDELIPRITPPPSLIDQPVYPPPQDELIPRIPPPPYTGEKPPGYPEPSPSPSPSPSPGGLVPLPSPSSPDPLYAAISGLLSQRPPVQPRETPVVLVPQQTTSPVLPLLLVVLGVGGVVAYAYLRRR